MKRIIYVFFAVFITAQASGQIRNITTRDTSVFSRAAKTETLPNKTLTAPKIASGGFIADANGNEYLKFGQTASAVNEVTVTNAATGARPLISATGGDANIDLNLSGKGAGVVRINGNEIPQSTPIVNVKEDIRPIYSQGNAVGDGTTNDAVAIQWGMYASNDRKKIIYLPAGNFVINAQIQLPYDAMEIRGAGIGKTTITIGSSYSGTSALFNMGGRSDFSISDMTITGNSKRIDAAIQIGSFQTTSTQARRILIERVRFYNLWTTDAIMFGGTSSGDTHANGDITIRDCFFENIFEPAVPIAYLDATVRCNAINLNQTTNKLIIANNYIRNVSGDGIYGYGQTQTTFNAEYGNWLIQGNHIEKCFMGIEINGQYLPKGIKIEGNIIKYSTRNGGYLISIDTYNASVTNNTLYGIERGLIECTSIGAVISGNSGSMVVYSSTTGGVAPTATTYSVACIEAYGFGNIISNNNFIIDRTGATSNTPSQMNGIKIVGRTTDTGTQPMSFDGISDASGYWDIKGNTVHGFSHRAIDCTTEKIRKVNITDNTFLSRVCVEYPLGIYGYNWIIKGNIIDLTGSANPIGGSGAINVFASQADNTVSIVQDNTIINDNWKLATTNLYVAFNNHLVNTTTNLAYQMFPAPPMTAAQRTALTGVEGMTVYQTDATAGVYVYKGGAWAAL